ncbi:hypothetical protein DH2020_045743 [Rehmannia glutinosa]|uniref:Uncharacterized protein n=1 Tax=Rehmannia glutinosa TaxID=99300 RepID=A0ABR0UE03_REHGL
MAHVVRPLIRWPWWRHPHSTISHLISLRASSTRAATNVLFFAFFSTSYRQVHFSSKALKLRGVNSLPDVNESDDEFSDSSETKKSRNERKREGRRAVRWGMELANFSPPQIKRILRVADLEQEVFDALMLVKDSMNSGVVTRWYDGLINKDISITNEIYSLREVEFDRQELRQLVRKVHSTLEYEANLEGNGKQDAAAVNARRSLSRFLRDLAEQLPAE